MMTSGGSGDMMTSTINIHRGGGGGGGVDKATSTILANAVVDDERTATMIRQ